MVVKEACQLVMVCMKKLQAKSICPALNAYTSEKQMKVRIKHVKNKGYYAQMQPRPSAIWRLVYPWQTDLTFKEAVDSCRAYEQKYAAKHDNVEYFDTNGNSIEG